MNLGTLIITGEKFRKPCVYEFISKGVVTYVGQSNVGFSRPFRGGSKHFKRVQAFNEADQIRVTVFSTTQEAKQEERRLIVLHQPIANTHYKYVPPPKIPITKLNREQRAMQDRQWIQAGIDSFKPGHLNQEDFLADIPKRTALWYRMKAAFEEGRRQAIQANPQVLYNL
jgi:hypothetical protein